jgi:hypothetical protein
MPSEEAAFEEGYQEMDTAQKTAEQTVRKRRLAAEVQA